MVAVIHTMESTRRRLFEELMDLTFEYEMQRCLDPESDDTAWFRRQVMRRRERLESLGADREELQRVEDLQRSRSRMYHDEIPEYRIPERPTYNPVWF